MLPLLRREACLALALVLAGCGSEPRIPTTITPTPSVVVLTALGQTQQLSTSVSDQNGNPLTEAAVTWSSTDETVASVSPTGLVTAQGPGTAEVIATAGSANATVAVSVVQTPTQISKVSGDGQTTTAGTALGLPIVVEVQDALGHPVAGTTVVFTPQGGGSVSPTTATTGGDGRASTTLTTGTVAGTLQTVIAGIVPTTLSVSFTATTTAGPAASVSLAAGNNQNAVAGHQVAVRPAVVVRDANANPVAGVGVEFEIVSGGGSISGGTTVTDNNGRAEVGSWTLGSGSNVLRATVTAAGISGNPVTFSASTAVIAFNIEVRFLSTATPAQAQAFTDAEKKWESLIVGDVEDGPIDAPAGSCDDGVPALNETIDDVIIFATIEPIDGAGGILGQAGPCFIRDPGFLPAVGVMFFDTDDLDFIQSEGLLDELILHEMGHVLGFGTLWPLQGLLAGSAGSGGADPHFTGSHAIAAFDDADMVPYTSGAKVPVENVGEPGTFDSHWRESVFDNELMTGFVNLGTNPLSAVTVASLRDQGYTVDLSKAEPYTLSAGLRIGPVRESLRLTNDVRRIPLKLLDKKGRLLRVLQR